MPLVISCPSCKAKLKAPDNAIGKAVKCPGCGSAIAVKAPAGAPNTVPAAPRQAAAPKPPAPRQPQPEDDYEVVEEDDLAPRGKGRPEPAEDDRPRKSVKSRADDDDLDDDRPSKPNAYLGAGFALDTDDLEIANVNEDSPADRAGLKVGDLIVRLDNKKVSKRSDLAAFLRKCQPGDEITVDVRTPDDEEVTIDVKLGRRPAE
jgi:membrane-associated protease RseP (regulator of RpoE activity)